jgi:purine-binding chemotaxis protein CheW
MNALVKSQPQACGAWRWPGCSAGGRKAVLDLHARWRNVFHWHSVHREIIWYSNLTEVPMMPACIRGVINLRGAVVPVMDLSSRFGKPTTPVTKSTCIIIVEVDTQNEGERQNMGVVVDSVQAVLEIPASDIEPRPPLAPRSAATLLKALAR